MTTGWPPWGQEKTTAAALAEHERRLAAATGEIRRLAAELDRCHADVGTFLGFEITS
ncbi:hypothetical protein AB0B45_34860 [Nonomuraea sp. NPDC049152]|uniref:hypothetical protein n=1 Tax=Nonomuraea sp. NPDC049152 TaxID=3154350 RepID=UPI0033FE9807